MGATLKSINRPPQRPRQHNKGPRRGNSKKGTGVGSKKTIKLTEENRQLRQGKREVGKGHTRRFGRKRGQVGWFWQNTWLNNKRSHMPDCGTEEAKRRTEGGENSDCRYQGKNLGGWARQILSWGRKNGTKGRKAGRTSLKGGRKENRLPEVK